MTATLERGEWSAHAPAALYPRERHGTHCTGGWVGHRVGLDGRKISSTPGFDPRTVQPVAQFDKQHEEKPEPTRYQHLEQHLHKKKQNEYGQRIHNIKYGKQNSENPMFHNPLPFQHKKLKCTLVQALRLCTGRTAHKGSRGIALLFLDHGTRRV